jgi:hypothetical protein
MGSGAVSNAANQFVAGSSSFPMTNIFFGKGYNNTTPTAYNLTGTAGTGTNVAGGSVNIRAGAGTGNEANGDVSVEYPTSSATSGTTLHTFPSVTARVGGVLGSNSVATSGVTFTGATDVTPTMRGTNVIPANILRAGSVVRVTAAGVLTQGVTIGDYSTLELQIGGNTFSTVWVTDAASGSQTQSFTITGVISAYANPGAVVSLGISGKNISKTNGVVAIDDVSFINNFDTTASLTIRLLGTGTIGTGSVSVNSFVIEIYP